MRTSYHCLHLLVLLTRLGVVVVGGDRWMPIVVWLLSGGCAAHMCEVRCVTAAAVPSTCALHLVHVLNTFYPCIPRPAQVHDTAGGAA